MMVNVPVSIGELLDKLSILEIKSSKIKDPVKLSFVINEKKILEDVLKKLHIEKSDFYQELLKVNALLWDIEDNIRLKEYNNDFGEEFIKLARSVYITNDKRSEIKSKINSLYNSDICEVKSYFDYNSKGD